MRKSILVSILLIGVFFCAYGQAGSDPIDLVLLLDTSSGMSSSYDRVNDYTTGSFLSEFLRVGDTFHLIAYSAKPRLDVARRITSRGDIETIVGRILLQYPVESGSDARAAIAFAEQYIASLPSRPKKVVMVGTGGSDVSGLVNAAKQRLGSRNISFDYVQVTPGQPLANLPSAGRGGSAPARQTAQPAPTTPQRVPGATGTQLNTQPPSSSASQTPQGSQPQTSTSSQTPGTPSTQQTTQGTGSTDKTTSPGSPSTQGTSSPGTSTPGTSAQGPSSQGAQDTQRGGSTGTDPYGTATGEPRVGTEGAVSGTTDDTYTADSGGEDTQGTGSFLTPKKLISSGDDWASSIPLIIGFIILALLVLFLIIFLTSRRLGSRPNRVMAAVSSSSKKQESDSDLAPFVDHSKDLASYAAKMKTSQRSSPTSLYTSKPIKPEVAKPVVINPSGPLLLNLFVDDQNTAIGKRNIHSLKSGYSLSVGGGKGDDFYIFLVPMPSHLGEIRRNGSQCSFIPRKPKYFPDLGSNELRDCINKTIRIVSDKNYEITFRFEMYEDPLIALNRILNSVKIPG